jgi:hypothetical protein
MMRWILFASLFALFCLPFAQQQFHFFNPQKLDGVEITLEPDTLNAGAWFEGRFQTKRERKINETLGLREVLVRSYNQYNYMCFHTSESPGVVIGKNNYLYLTSYINNYCGNNFIGWLKTECNVRRLKMIQDALKKKNIDLLVVLAPGKASFYPENIPEEFTGNPGQNNYNAYRRYFIKEKINFLDLSQWFNQLKPESKYKLYPKYGVHWTYYGACLAADTLRKSIEALRRCNLPAIQVNNIAMEDSLRQPDYDVGELLNIYTTFKDTLPYPEISFVNIDSTTKPKFLIISDSYVWQWNELKFLQNTFNDWSFWFYNNTMYPESFVEKKFTADINYCETIQEKDIIVLLASEGTLDLFPYGFLDKTEPLYFPKDKNELIDYYQLKIKGDSAWLRSVILKAIQKKIPVAKSLHEDAEWMASNQGSN